MVESNMQQKIKELYEKSLEQNISNNMAWEELNPEKFAELIVKECINSIDQFDHHGNPAKEIVPIIISQIKEKFGVKE
jgi:carbon monoxide dehydrogenase subunit G